MFALIIYHEFTGLIQMNCQKNEIWDQDGSRASPSKASGKNTFSYLRSQRFQEFGLGGINHISAAIIYMEKSANHLYN